ncbi:hypothetical protein [uncultured Flavobacterium sp.]|uniref:hypothetical protein n=1 Tax=uncultured Flavobacterium sp. TaxID=165435 RepID=UPI0030EF99C6|tara:strand:- start:42827 stop:43363 length:537 start_codon:yes stop_codon:yes gene_type:complete
MSLQKEEKKFWLKHFRIEKSESIPKEWNNIGGYGYGDEQTDDYFYFISLRVDIVHEIYLKESYVTDEGVKHMMNFKNLRKLHLRKHDQITKESIPYFNKMESLESLNITRTQIALSDLCEDLNNQSLKEIFLDSNDDDTEENILKKAYVLKDRMPNCNVYLDCSNSTDVFGNSEKPIF